MPQQKSHHIVLDLTEAELRALRLVLDCPFVGDDDDLAAVVGPHHHHLKTAKRMRSKVLIALGVEDAR